MSETTSLRDTLHSRDAVLRPAPPSKEDPISGAWPRSRLDDAVDLGLAPLKETTSRREAGPSRAPETWSAPAANAARKRKMRSLGVFEGDAALKELWSSLAVAPADQTPEPPPAPAKTPIFASTVRLMWVVALAAGGALSFLWVTPANKQTGEEAALASRREMPRSAAQNDAAERAPDPLAAAEQAPGVALYQDFLKWRQQVRSRESEHLARDP